MKTPAGVTTAVIGDVHGCGDELRELLTDIDRSCGTVALVFVGDLLTKGPAPHTVVTEILKRRRAGQKITLVCGNHDQRMLLALVRMEAGVRPEALPRTERQCWQILHKKRLVPQATELMVECNETVELRGVTAGDPQRAWTVVHGGIEPKLGLARTPDQLKIHIKAEDAEPHWWERYRGDDGLIIVGHKPLLSPMILRKRDGTPCVVNIDTGCAYGNALTAYLPDEDRLIQVPSMQYRGDQYRSLRSADESGSTRAIAARLASAFRIRKPVG
ncbi:MAG: metallophosphoesterase [Phycisphaerae bacterium]|nr:metallophosphoesterase [Phycisphaerae bacterium]